MLGIKEEIVNELSNRLADNFYLGFAAQEAPLYIEKAIKRYPSNLYYHIDKGMI